MFRILIALVLVGVALWYMLKDGEEKKQVLEQQRQTLESAKEVAKATDEVSAAMAARTDAIRDEMRIGQAAAKE